MKKKNNKTAKPTRARLTDFLARVEAEIAHRAAMKKVAAEAARAARRN